MGRRARRLQLKCRWVAARSAGSEHSAGCHSREDTPDGVEQRTKPKSVTYMNGSEQKQTSVFSQDYETLAGNAAV